MILGCAAGAVRSARPRTAAAVGRAPASFRSRFLCCFLRQAPPLSSFSPSSCLPLSLSPLLGRQETKSRRRSGSGRVLETTAVSVSNYCLLAAVATAGQSVSQSVSQSSFRRVFGVARRKGERRSGHISHGIYIASRKIWMGARWTRGRQAGMKTSAWSAVRAI